jgi:uncharacterized membrane protein YccC
MRNRLPMHVINGVSVALGIGLIQALLHAAAGPRAAALAMTGAIYASLADLPLRPERNWRRVGAGALMGLGAATLMLLTRPHPHALGITIALITFCAMMMLGWGPRAGPASFAAVLSIVFTMGLPAGQPALEALRWQAVGAVCYLLWSVATSIALQPRYRRLSLAAALDASARLLRARIAVLRGERGAGHEALREWVRSEAQLADRLQLARDLLFAAAPAVEVRRQTAVLMRLIDLRDLLLASSLDIDRLGADESGRHLRERYTDRLEQLALALVQARTRLRGGGGALPALDQPALPGADEFDPADPRRPLLPAMERRLQRLAGEVRRVDALLRGAQEAPLLDRDELRQFVAPEGWPLRSLEPHRSLASPVLRHALRASAALAAAYTIALALPWASHPQWLVLSVAVVLRNTFDQTVLRRNLRVAGTVLGCLVVLALAQVSSPLALSAVFLVAIGLAHGFSVERYLVTAMAGTVMALLQAHLVAPDEGFPIAERIADTVLGAALAWAFSYMLPSWERRQLPAAIERMLAALRDYARRVLSPADAASVEQRLARRRAYDMVGALAASVQRSLVEPAGVRPALQPLALLIDQAQRLMAHLSTARLLLQRSASEADARAVAQAVSACAAAVDAALDPAAAPIVPPDTEIVTLEPPAGVDPAALQPWLAWRLQITERNAIDLRSAARAALENLRP